MRQGFTKSNPIGPQYSRGDLYSDIGLERTSQLERTFALFKYQPFFLFGSQSTQYQFGGLHRLVSGLFFLHSLFFLVGGLVLYGIIYWFLRRSASRLIDLSFGQVRVWHSSSSLWLALLRPLSGEINWFLDPETKGFFRIIGGGPISDNMKRHKCAYR